MLIYAKSMTSHSRYKTYFIFTGVIFPFTLHLTESITNIFPKILVAVFIFNIYLFIKQETLQNEESLNNHNNHSSTITWASIIFLIIFTTEIAYSFLEIIFSIMTNFIPDFILQNYKTIELILLYISTLLVLSIFVVDYFFKRHT